MLATLASAGCWSSSSNNGAGGTTGTGGAGAGGATDGGTDTGASDAQSSSDGSDARTGDASADTSGPCTTSFGAASSVQYAFNQGANNGWYQFVGHDEGNTGLTSSLGASFTEGHACPGSLLLAGNFVAYQAPTLHNQSVSTEIYFPANGNPSKNWSAYKTLHAWIKVQTADFLGLNGVYFYVKSATGGSKYLGTFAASAMLHDWYEVTLDLTNVGTAVIGVTSSDVQLIGFELALNQTAPTGGPATPSQAFLLIDDIWLEALPATDGGSGDGATTDAGAGQ